MYHSGLARKLFLALALLCLGVTAREAPAAPATAPAKPFLIVEGAVRSGTLGPDGRLRRVFTEAEVLAMPTHVITTRTNWRPVSDFVGPTLKSILIAAGADVSACTHIEMYALNEYAVTIPIGDLARYNPVLAHTVAGQRLPRRDYGPLWLMYPRSDFEELRDNALSDGKLIWQVYRILVH